MSDGGIVHMGAMGLLVAVLAPAIVLLGRRLPAMRLTPPAVATLAGFVVLHDGMTVAMAQLGFPPLVDLALHGVLLAAAVLFWLPVLGPGSRVGDAGRCVYLFVAAPLLDLSALVIIARGDGPGGLAMIVGMLPMSVAAMAVTWRWVTREERLAQLAERAQPAAERVGP